METEQPSPRRTAKACVICHKKKIKCNLEPGSRTSCTACVRDGYECRPRERKRKRIYSLESESPPPKLRKESVQESPKGESQTDESMLSPESVRNSTHFQNHGMTPNELTKVIPANNWPMSNGHDRALVESSSVGARSGSRPSLGYLPSKVSYLGRSEYIGDDVPINDLEEAPPHSTRGLSDKDMEILQIQQVFDMPAQAVRESLIGSYWSRCAPWTPIVERHWIEGRPQNEVSILLLQSMMLAGSRVSSSSVDFGSPEELYSRAKTLFWMGVERDPMIMTVSAILMNWWNPESPEHYSIDTSGFWVRIAVGLSYQLGLHRDPGDKPDASLRRRTWWSLVIRDNLINAGHGRPRAIQLEVTNVALPTVDDFDGDLRAANTFSAYAGISMVLGDLTQSMILGDASKRQSLGDRTFRWIKTVPDSLQLCYTQSGTPLRPYNFEARQLHVQYFTVLSILNKSKPASTSPSTASLLAASFIAGIFEDFLARDELRYLGPIFTFYLLAAGVTLLSSYRFAGLWHLAEQDLNIIIKSQEELGKRWPSAIGSLKRITDVKAKVLQSQRSSYLPENNLTPEQMQFYEGFGPDLCRSWNILYPGSSKSAARDLMTAGILQDLSTPVGLYPDATQNADGADGVDDMPFDPQMLDTQFSLDSYRGIGNWLFNDWQGTQGASYW